MSKRIIISENQLDVITESVKVLHYDFETKVRKYLGELKNNPLNPKFDSFFTDNGISEDALQNKMLDLGLIQKKDSIDEPEDANGKKHSVYKRKYIFSGSSFDDKIDKLYDAFFNSKKGVLKEDEGCVGVGDAAPSSGGATNTAGVGGQYTVPFAGIQRRKVGTSGNTESNIDMNSSLERKKGKIAVNTNDN